MAKSGTDNWRLPMHQIKAGEDVYIVFQAINSTTVSSLFIFLGLTFSALSASKDMELRKNIIKFTKDSFNPIANIGSAEEEISLKERILKTIDHNKEVLEQTDGINSSLTSQEVSKMVDKVMQEIKNKKNTSAGSS